MKCGLNGHYKADCPYSGQLCYNCLTYSHVTKECPKKLKKYVLVELIIVSFFFAVFLLSCFIYRWRPLGTRKPKTPNFFLSLVRGSVGNIFSRIVESTPPTSFPVTLLDPDTEILYRPTTLCLIPSSPCATSFANLQKFAGGARGMDHIHLHDCYPSSPHKRHKVIFNYL